MGTTGTLMGIPVSCNGHVHHMVHVPRRVSVNRVNTGAKTIN